MMLLMKRFYAVALLVILAVAVFFRFSNASVRYGIGDDSSRDAFVAYQEATVKGYYLANSS